MKTTLIASAIAATFGAQAVTITSPTNSVYSKQAQTFAGATAAITTTDLVVDLGAEYSENDTIRIYFKDPAAALADSFANLDTAITATNGTAGTDLVGITLGKLTSPTGDESEAHFRVSNVDNQFGVGTTGLVVDFAEGVVNSATLKINSAAVVAGSTVELCWEALTNTGAVIEKGCFDVAEVKDQFNALAMGAGDKLNGEIDVTMMREIFTGEGATEAQPTLEDSLVINKTVVNTASWATAVAEGDITVVLNGDFTDLTSAHFTSANALTGPTLDVTEQMVTMTYPATFTTDTITFTSTGNGDGTDTALIDQEFTVDAEQAYTCQTSVPGLPTCPAAPGNTGVETLNTGTDAGEWTLNGAQINIPYMPYTDADLPAAQRAIGQIIYVTNHSSLDAGSVYVTATAEDGTEVLSSEELAQLGPNEMVKLTGAINAALVAKGFTSGKLSIDIVVNAADENITVYAAYKHNSETDRGVVITDQYKGKM